MFGPVLVITEVESFKQAIKVANLSPYGLTACVFTKSKLKANRALREIEAGAVFVNEARRMYPGAPQTGLKQSGVGSEKSKHGIWEFTHKRHIHVNYTNDKTRDWWFPY